MGGHVSHICSLVVLVVVVWATAQAVTVPPGPAYYEPPAGHWTCGHSQVKTFHLVGTSSEEPEAAGSKLESDLPDHDMGRYWHHLASDGSSSLVLGFWELNTDRRHLVIVRFSPDRPKTLFVGSSSGGLRLLLDGESDHLLWKLDGCTVGLRLSNPKNLGAWNPSDIIYQFYLTDRSQIVAERRRVSGGP